MSPTVLRVSIFIVSWLSVIFLPNKRKIFVKFLPVSLFSAVLVLCEIFIFTTNKLWKVKGGRKMTTLTGLLMLFGPYLTMNIWVFYLSRGKFLLFALINIIVDWIYAFPGLVLLNKLGVFKIKVKPLYFYIMILGDALLNFCFQKFLEKIYPQLSAYDLTKR